MHTRLQDMVTFLDDARNEVQRAVATDPPDPAEPGRWSVADNLDHLRMVENSVSKLFHVTLTRFQGPLPQETESDSILHRLDHLQLADRCRKVSAPAMVQPVRNRPRAEVLADLATSRVRLLATLKQADGVALGQFSYQHEILGVLDFYQWLLFVGHHERRHAAQILDRS